MREISHLTKKYGKHTAVAETFEYEEGDAAGAFNTADDFVLEEEAAESTETAAEEKESEEN